VGFHLRISDAFNLLLVHAGLLCRHNRYCTNLPQ